MLPHADRYFIVHLQKTGGTALVHRLRERFDPAEVYPDTTDGNGAQPTISIDHLLNRWESRGKEIRIVTGHFPICTAELLGGRFKTVTVVRDPVERTLSYLRHHREMTPEDRDKPLELIYEDPFRFYGLIHNHMVKMLSLTVDEMTHGVLSLVEFTPQHLARAKRNLVQVEVLGFQEHFAEFWYDLDRRLGWSLGEPIHYNRTDPVATSESFRARIAKDNALDLELYEYALSVRERRNHHYNASSAETPDHVRS